MGGGPGSSCLSWRRRLWWGSSGEDDVVGRPCSDGDALVGR